MPCKKMQAGRAQVLEVRAATFLEWPTRDLCYGYFILHRFIALCSTTLRCILGRQGNRLCVVFVLCCVNNKAQTATGTPPL